MAVKRPGMAFAVAAAFVLAVAAAMMAAAPVSAQDGEAQVRVAHLASDGPNVDVAVNDEPVAELEDVPYGTVSPYLPLPAGTQNIKVFASGDMSEPVVDADVELVDGEAYTVAAIGLVSDGSIGAQVYEDDLSAPSEGNVSLRVVHASPDAGPVDVVPEGGDALVSALEFPNASPNAEVPEGTYTLNVNAAGTDQTAIQVPDATLESGAVLTAFAVGTAAGDLDVLVTADMSGDMMMEEPMMMEDSSMSMMMEDEMMEDEMMMEDGTMDDSMDMEDGMMEDEMMMEDGTMMDDSMGMQEGMAMSDDGSPVVPDTGGLPLIAAVGAAIALFSGFFLVRRYLTTN